MDEQALADALRRGRFRIDRLLKQVGSRRTYAGFDPHTMTPVVVKTIDRRGLSAVVQAMIEHESDVLVRLDEPLVSPLLDAGGDDDVLYVVMPLLGGMTLAEHLASAGPLDPVTGAEVGRRLAVTLAAAHEAGVLHRDVKPSNVMVHELAGRERTCTLVDFGFSWNTQLGPGELVPSTLEHLAPEASGLIDVVPDARSDLYSLGVLLFRALSGEPPYRGASPSELLRQHLVSPIPSLRAAGVAVPRALDEIVQRLLAKDPAERYQSAMAVAHDLARVTDQLELGAADPQIVVGQEERRGTLAMPVFVGRHDELGELRGQLEAAPGDKGRLVLVESVSGGGKSRLLSEFSVSAGQQGAWLLHGQGLDQAAPKPLQVLRGVAAGLLEACSSDEGLARRLVEAVGDDAQAIVDALPALGEVLGLAATTLGSEEHGEQRSVRALHVLLDALGRLDRPLVVVLDDCQWADELTLKVLRTWSRTSSTAGGVLVVASFRTEEVDAQHPLRMTPCDLHVRLAGLDRSSVLALLESMAGHLPSAAVDLVARRCEGSPFMAAAMLRGMVEEDVLCWEGDGWRLDDGRLDALQGSVQSAAFLCRRIDLLEPTSRRLLEVGAVLGKSFDLSLAATLRGCALSEVIRCLQEPKHRHIVWFDHRSGTASFTHDKLRESVLDALGDSARRDLHRRAALRLEDLDPDRAFELAYHFDAAGMSDRALPHALSAAASSRAQHSLQVANEQYLIARRGVDPDDAETVRCIADGLGSVAMLRGQYDAAHDELSLALRHAHDPIDVAELQGRLGELAFKRGDSGEAARLTSDALRSLGRRVPGSVLGHIMVLVVALVVQAWHTVVPDRWVQRRSLDKPRATSDLLAARLLSRLAHAYWFSGGSLPTAAMHLQGMNLAERYPPTLEVAQSYSEHAPVMTLITWFSRGIRYAERSLQIRRDLGDVWGQGQSLHFYGVVLYGASRYQECIERCREAIRLLERTGDQWEVNTARWHVAYSLYRLGRVDEALAVAREVHRAGETIGDAQARGISLAAWSKASGGEVPADLVAREVGLISTDVHTGAEVLQAEAIRLLRAGRPDDAVAALRRARRMVVRALAMQEYVAPVFVWLATAHRQLVESSSAFALGGARAHLRAARRASLAAVLVSRAYQNNLPHALRESALVHAMMGRERAAVRRFERSESVGREQQAMAEVLATLQARVRVGLALGWDVTEARRREEELASRLGEGGPGGDAVAVQVTASLVDRFEGVLEAGRRITGALTRDAVHSAVQDAVVSVLRGDRCSVVEVAEGLRGIAHGDLDARIDQGALDRAIHGRRPVVFDDRSGSSEGGGGRASVRSGLAVPIVVNGAVAFVVQLTSSHVCDLYGPQELRLAHFIATLAGAALENVRGFDEVAGRSSWLEHEVAVRTLELEDAVAAERRARAESERHASLMTQLAEAGRRMSSLDPQDVLLAVMQVVRDFGFEASEICVLDEDGTYEVAQQFGLPPQYTGRRHAQTQGVVGRALAAGTTVVVDDYRRLPDALGEIVELGFQTSIAAPILSHGRPAGVIVAGCRVRRELHQDEVEAFELLAAQVGHALENARAYEEQLATIDRLGQLDRLKDDFLESASHELRTPLAVISGMVQTLDTHWERLRDEPTGYEFIQRMRANATALTSIINDLLDFSRMQQGHMVVERAPLDLSRVVAATADRLAPLFEDHDFVVDPGPGVGVVADEMLLGRALENLLSNAVRYTPVGTQVRLRVGVREGVAEVSVEDDGKGIAPGELEHITERFYRGAEATLSSRRGLGLGLAFTSEILQMHGTRLEVSNAAGAGARFAFRLPTVNSPVLSRDLSPG